MLTIALVRIKPSEDARIRVLTRALRTYIQREKSTGWAELGRRLGMTAAWVQTLAEPEKYGDKSVGLDVILFLSDRFTARSLDRLFRVAVDDERFARLLSKNVERPVGEERPRHPKRKRAAPPDSRRQTGES